MTSGVNEFSGQVPEDQHDLIAVGRSTRLPHAVTDAVPMQFLPAVCNTGQACSLQSLPVAEVIGGMRGEGARLCLKMNNGV